MNATQWTWSPDPPGQPGYYWYSVADEAPVIVRVETRHGVLCVDFRDAEIVAPVVSLTHAKWAGPLLPPSQ